MIIIVRFSRFSQSEYESWNRICKIQTTMFLSIANLTLSFWANCFVLLSQQFPERCHTFLHSGEYNPSYIFSTPGTYTVSAEITAGTEVITFTEDIIISQNPTAFPTDDLFVCDDNNDGVAIFDFTT